MAWKKPGLGFNENDVKVEILTAAFNEGADGTDKLLLTIYKAYDILGVYYRWIDV